MLYNSLASYRQVYISYYKCYILLAYSRALNKDLVV